MFDQIQLHSDLSSSSVRCEGGMVAQVQLNKVCTVNADRTYEQSSSYGQNGEHSKCQEKLEIQQPREGTSICLGFLRCT